MILVTGGIGFTSANFAHDRKGSAHESIVNVEKLTYANLAAESRADQSIPGCSAYIHAQDWPSVRRFCAAIREVPA
jgi:dTDP-D-glucose 4,6-dehydratase